MVTIFKICQIILIIILSIIYIEKLIKHVILHLSYNSLKNQNTSIFGKNIPICLINDSIGYLVFSCTFDDFVKKFGNRDIHVVYIKEKNAYMNILENHYISPSSIIIDNEIILPTDFKEYHKIWKYLCEDVIIHYTYTKDFKEETYSGYSAMMDFLTKQNDINECIKDIIVIECLLDNTPPFIYYDKQDKIIYLYGVVYDPTLIIGIIAHCLYEYNTHNYINNIYTFTNLIERMKPEASISNYYWFTNIEIINDIKRLLTHNKPEILSYLLKDWEVNPYITSLWRGHKCLHELNSIIKSHQK